MASTNSIIFPESMADILAIPVDICFGSMPAQSTAPTACLVIKGNTVTSNQQVRIDLLAETHPPTPRDLIAGLDRVEGMLSDTIKICERVKRPHMTSTPPTYMPLGLRNVAHVASRYMKCKIQIESGPKTAHHGNSRGHLDDPCPIHENSKHTPPSVVCSRSFADLSSRLIAARSTMSRLQITSRFRSPVRPSPRTIQEKCLRS
jgi:hypothetical protein